MSYKKGDLIINKRQFVFESTIVVSVILDNDIGNNKCHVRDLFTFMGGKIVDTMNWSNIDKGLIVAYIASIEDYSQDFPKIQTKMPIIIEALQEIYPEYAI